MIVDSILQRVLNIDDPLWERKAATYIGEFVLCLTPLDIIDNETKTPSIGHPSTGRYLYFMEATPFIKRFLRAESKNVAQLFDRQFRDILADFDKQAMRLSSPGCFPDGFTGGAVNAAFPESTNQKTA